MTMKEISAAVMVLSAIVFSVWVASDLLTKGAPAEVSQAAWNMLWAIGWVIVFNIVAVIIGVIVVSIAQREEVKDERADERDKVINSRAMSTGYFVLSIGIVGVLLLMATGMQANLVPYVLFGISMLAGVAFAVSQLVLYRLG